MSTSWSLMQKPLFHFRLDSNNLRCNTVPYKAAIKRSHFTQFWLAHFFRHTNGSFIFSLAFSLDLSLTFPWLLDWIALPLRLCCLLTHCTWGSWFESVSYMEGFHKKYRSVLNIEYTQIHSSNSAHWYWVSYWVKTHTCKEIRWKSQVLI